MAGGWKARRLSAIALAALVWGMALSSADAQQGAEPAAPDAENANNAEMVRLYRAGKYAEATEIAKRVLARREAALGPDNADVALSLQNLAQLYLVQARYAEAEPLYRRSIAILERVNHPDLGTALNGLGALYRDQARYAEAEPLFRRYLTIAERALGPEHLSVALALNNLAVVYRAQDRTAEAEPLYRRSLAIRERELGPNDLVVSATLINLARVYEDQGRPADAEPLYRRSLAIRERALGPDHPDVATALNSLAGFYRVQGRYGEAEPLDKRSLAIRERALGPDHPDVATALSGLADFYRVQGRYGEAEPLDKRSLAIRERALGPDHPDVAISLGNLAWPAVAQRDWARAAYYWRRATGVIQRRAERGLAGRAEGPAKGESQQFNSQFAGLIRVTHFLTVQGGAEREAQARNMFDTAQWAQSSEAATSLAQMAARSAKGSPELAGLVRERQDLVGEWRAKDKLLIAAKSELPAKRKAEAEKVLADRLAAIDIRLAEINRRFAQDFPDYAALASPAPVSVAEVQAQLGADEALMLFLDTSAWQGLMPEETFVWVVTKTDMRWVRSALGTAALTREVTALRCGLDATAWDGDGAEKCVKTLGIPRDKARGSSDPLPFDQARAYKLYAALFGEVADLIEGKHLLIVPSGALTQLPFQVLVTKPPTSGDHRGAAWLVREHAITALPAVSSLTALRRVGRPSVATRPMIGFGNPLLDGPDARYAARAKLARAKQSCAERRPDRLATRSDHRASPLRVETRGGLASVSHIKGQVPLPETADELCAVAEDVNAEAVRDVLLGAKATEREIKRLSASGELAKYRIVHLATHGFLSGQLDGTHEPGLILTPPEKATEEDDGYLSASEIASLKLDADLVILSACNTAAGAATSAEALSGLARAFIYAQARALLVSHWEVYSDATVKLITATVREMARDPKVGRSEALRRSMLALIDKGELREAHPAYWAPFVVVGEGSPAR